MDLKAISFDDIQRLINNAVIKLPNGRPLRKAQIVVLQGFWEDMQYEEMSKCSSYKVDYLRNKVAGSLCQTLTEVFGQDVTKRNFHKIITSAFADEPFTASTLEKVDKSSDFCGIPQLATNFYGRLEELCQLKEKVESSRCIAIVGMPGIGKTALASALCYQDLSAFDKIVWHYSISKSPEQEVVSLLRTLKKKGFGKSTETFLNILQDQKLLIVIDGIENWLHTNRFEVEQFVRTIIESSHQSCLILTSREPISIVNHLSEYGRPCFSLRLGRLKTEDALQILDQYNLDGEKLYEFINEYQGNPQFLHRICRKIKIIGNIDDFLSFKTSISNDLLRNDFDSLFLLKGSQIEDIERFILVYLSVEGSDASLPRKDVINHIANISDYKPKDIIKGIENLASFSLIELHDDARLSGISVSRAIQAYILRNSENFPTLKDLQLKRAVM
jgi:Holliday junction resolvasome RuvABC ATP-dependent DNA helicase subunit